MTPDAGPQGALLVFGRAPIAGQAKTNGLEPYHYLRYLLSELPAAEALEQLEALLPWNLSAEQLAIEANPTTS